MKLLTVVGARPQFVKAATISRRLRDPEFSGITEILVHTGQHYDANLSAVFFDELGIPEPAHNLNVGSGSQAVQTSGVMVALEPLIDTEKPDMILVYGDTNSTMGAAIVAAKAGVALAHVEAGLRSRRRAMPEEINRIVTDRLSDLLFCPSSEAMSNLRDEGHNDAYIVGDVMLDGFRYAMSLADNRIAETFEVEPGQFVLATIHRAESTDSSSRLSVIIQGLGKFSEDLPVVLPLHPRTRKMIAQYGLHVPSGIRIVDPLPYLSMVSVISNAAAIATDSGGLQKEACFAGVPCVTLRDETEWVETIKSGWNRLPVMTAAGIADALRASLVKPETAPPDYGDGDAAGKILRHIINWSR